MYQYICDIFKRRVIVLEITEITMNSKKKSRRFPVTARVRHMSVFLKWMHIVGCYKRIIRKMIVLDRKITANTRVMYLPAVEPVLTDVTFYHKERFIVRLSA